MRRLRFRSLCTVTPVFVLMFGVLSAPAVIRAAPPDPGPPLETEPASPAKPDERWRYGAAVGTDVPINIGARLFAEAPFRLRLSTTIGYLPSFYSTTLNDILVGFGAYPQSTGDLIQAALKSSLVWRTHIGFRPFPKLGLYADVGYGLVTLGGGASSGELISGITGITVPSGTPVSSLQFDIKSTLHMADVEIGYEWLLFDRLSLRGAVGGAFTLTSDATVKPASGSANNPLINQFCLSTANYLTTTYNKYVHTPVVSVSAGYSF